MNFATKQMILHSGRSWWQARYSDGKVLSEWDTLVNMLLLPLGKSNSSRWEEVPKEHMIGLRLLCPNGMCGELEAKEGSKNPVRNGVYKCKSCRKQFTVTVGTIFEDSHIALNKWLMAIKLL